MGNEFATKVTITLPHYLVVQLDKLAEHDLTNRSTIIRQAIREYINLPRNRSISNPDSTKMNQMYEVIKNDNPHIDPNDAELVKFLYDHKTKQE